MDVTNRPPPYHPGTARVPERALTWLVQAAARHPRARKEEVTDALPTSRAHPAPRTPPRHAGPGRPRLRLDSNLHRHYAARYSETERAGVRRDRSHAGWRQWRNRLSCFG